MVQQAHLHLLARSRGLAEERRAIDFRPPPGLGRAPAYSMYIDNLCVIGTSEASVNEVLQRGCDAWESAGLVVHEFQAAAKESSSLGGDQRGSPPSSGISKKRADMLYGGLSWLLHVKCFCTSAEMGHLVGHLTFAALFKRESLAVFRSVYDFIGRDYTVPVALWPSVRRELQMMKGLLVLLRRRLDRPWSSSVLATDACETGHASVLREVGLGRVASVGSWQERWRYKHVDSSDPDSCPRACAEYVLNVREKAPADDKNELFAEVPADVYTGDFG